MKEMVWYFIMFFGMAAADRMNYMENTTWDGIGQEYTAYVIDVMENIERQDVLRQDIPGIYGKIVQNEQTMQEAEEELRALPKERIGVCIENGDLDTGGIADELARCWDKYRGRNHYALSIMYAGEDEKREAAMLPFLNLLEDECRSVLEENWMDAENFPAYIRLERLNGLDIYTFHSDAQRKSEEKEYLVILNGTWEGCEVSWQYVIFPGTEFVFNYMPSDPYCTTQADINYDGYGDLLIREGYSSGSGGSWTNYRGLIWKAETGKFVWYESLPDQISSFEFEKERIIERYQLGAFHEYVCEYRVIDGEYVETRKLAWEDGTLFYYEMGVLVRQYDTTGMDYYDVCALYPDLDYWWRG